MDPGSGSVRSVKAEENEEPLMQKIRQPDKAADEPAKGKALRYRGFFFLRVSALKA